MSDISLLQRQRYLIAFLTTPDAYERGAGALVDYPGLEGLDAARLALLARLSLGKRMEKIEAVLPQTFLYLGDRLEGWTRAFATQYPPASPSRYDNAEQFHRFLVSRWRDEPPSPPYLPDIARFEMAFAKVRMCVGETTAVSPQLPEDGALPPGLQLRRAFCCELMHCRWDIRPLFDVTQAGTPTRGDCFLAIAISDPVDGPRVFKLPRDLFALLSTLDDWQPLPDELPPYRTSPAPALLRDLAGRGILEIRT